MYNESCAEDDIRKDPNLRISVVRDYYAEKERLDKLRSGSE